MLEKAAKLLEQVFLARVPRMTRPEKTMHTPQRSSEQAQVKASIRFSLESVESSLMGFWAPVRMMGLSAPCTR